MGLQSFGWADGPGGRLLADGHGGRPWRTAMADGRDEQGGGKP
jgi:hypothetical protein